MAAKIKLVEKRVRFSSLEQMVKLQFLLYCFTKDLHLTPGDYSLLTHIALYGYDRKSTPAQLVENKVFLHKQSVRNTRNKLLKQGFLVESPKYKYTVSPEFQIETSSPIMIDFKALNA